MTSREAIARGSWVGKCQEQVSVHTNIITRPQTSSGSERLVVIQAFLDTMLASNFFHIWMGL